MQTTILKALVASAAVAFGLAAHAADITGAGATFPYPIYAKWADAYKKQTGLGMNYQSIGSGGGIAQIKAKTVDFGASDMPLKPEDLQAAGLTQFPAIIGGVVPVVNLDGVASGALKFTGPVLADIYLGKIKTWNDKAIADLNPGVKLPADPITVVRRSDGSGTTFNFASYLGMVSAEWKNDVGADTAIDWPVGIGAKGNEGVAGNVAQLAGSIGYVEYAYAKQNRLSHVKMINRAGQAVEPGVESFRTAAQSADWTAAAKDNFYTILTNQPGAASWPITAATYILVYKNPGDKQATANSLKFFNWAFDQGDQLALGLDFVPLPDNAVAAIKASWKGIAGSGM